MAYKTDNLPDFYKPEETFRLIGDGILSLYRRLNSVFQNSVKKCFFGIQPSYGPYNLGYPCTEMLFMIKK